MLAFKQVVDEAQRVFGKNKYPEISLHGGAFSHYLAAQEGGDWETVNILLFESIEKLKRAGAELIIIPANSVHFGLKEVQAQAGIPVLNIVDIVVRECVTRRYARVALLATKFVMAGGLYEKPLNDAGIQLILPSAVGQEKVNNIIYGELVSGIIRDNSRDFLVGMMRELHSHGAQAVILGCTELPLILQQTKTTLPLLDSTALLARAAVSEALGVTDILYGRR